jgi:hypothetical protein
MHYKLSGVKNNQIEVGYEQASKWKTVNNGTLFTRPSPVSYEHPLGLQIVCQQSSSMLSSKCLVSGPIVPCPS